MALMLAKEEEIIKSWDFASINIGAEKTRQTEVTSTMSLTVTNKRMVLQAESERHLGRKEVLLKDISGVEVSRSLTRTVPSKIGAVFMLLLSVLSFIIAFTVNEPAALVSGIALGVICLIVSILLFIRKGKEIISFELSIYSKASSANIIDAYFGDNLFQENRKTAPKNLIMQISLCKEDVFEISDVIGSLIAQYN